MINKLQDIHSDLMQVIRDLSKEGPDDTSHTLIATLNAAAEFIQSARCQAFDMGRNPEEEDDISS